MARGVPKSVLDILSGVPLFSSCTKQELRAIAGLVTPMTIAGEKNLTTQGETGREFFVIQSGDARCLVDGVEIATLASGDFFGEMALVESLPRNATVVAKNEMKVMVLSAREFQSLLNASPAIAEKIGNAVANREHITPSSGVE